MATYATRAEYNLYLEGFYDEFYDTEADFETDAKRCYRKINEVLRNVDGVDVPIEPGADGIYPESIVEWQCKMHIWQKMFARKGIEWGDQMPDWMDTLREDYIRIMEGVMRGDILFADQLASDEVGISDPASDSGNTGTALFFTDNSRERSFYTGTDFPEHFSIRIKSVEDATAIDGATWEYSIDKGRTWYTKTSSKTSRDWKFIMDRVSVRWEYPVSTTGSLFVTGDLWTFTCVPYNEATVPDNRTRILFDR